MKSPYHPIQGSIAWKVIEYFTTNPEEVLTLDDLSAKFDKPRGQFHSILSAAVDAGVLKRDTDEDDEIVYRLGSGTPAIKPSQARNPSLRHDALLAGADAGYRPKASRARRSSAPVEIDFAKIELRDDVPIPALRSGSLETDMQALLGRMKLKQSFILPLAAKHIARKVVTQFKKEGRGTLTIRVLNENELGVWRVS